MFYKYRLRNCLCIMTLTLGVGLLGQQVSAAQSITRVGQTAENGQATGQEQQTAQTDVQIKQVEQKQVESVKLDVKQATYKSVTLNWNTVDGAGKYVIYRSEKKSGGFQKIKTIKEEGTLQYINYTDSRIKKQKSYYYKVEAYQGTKKIQESSIVTITTSVKVPQFRVNRKMARGQSFYLNYKRKATDCKIEVKSSNPNVVEITRKGKVTAKACGNSMLTVKVQKNQFTYKLKIRVRVVYSDYYKEAETKLSGSSKTQKNNPLIEMTQNMLVGETTDIDVNNLHSDTKIQYVYANDNVANPAITVDNNGTICAKATGTAKVTAIVKQDGYTYKFITKVYVSEKPEIKVTKKQVDKFFSDAVFIGDSVTMGWRNYAVAQGAGFLGGAKFLCAGSFSYFNNLKPVGATTVHPVYKGEKCTMEDGLKLLNAKKCYIILGVNDMFSGVETSYANTLTVLDKIRAKNPGIQIYLVSCTGIAKGGERGNLTNANIRQYNKKIKAYAATADDVEYVALAKHLLNNEGYIKEEYSSDGYVHLVHNAYSVWEKVFRKNAIKQLKKEKEQQQLVQEAYYALLTAQESCLKKEVKIAKKKIKAIEDEETRKAYMKLCKKIVCVDA